jgi:site-specific DNA-methyltransferase (adenine-specific)/adenine-specific DNA-methyltransferase
MKDNERQELIRLLSKQEEISPEWARIIFPPEKREYELVYQGKKRVENILSDTLAIPLQPVRTFNKNGEGWHNKVIFGDNLQVMKSLLELKRGGKLCNADGTPGVKLVYIDPPFATKQEFRGTQDQKAYQDKIAGARFIEFMRERLILIKELLSENGSVYIHLDWRKLHYIKVILDELFGETKLQNEIIWQRHDPHNDAVTRFGRIHDVLLWYSMNDKPVFNYQDITESLSQAALFEYNMAVTEDGQIVAWNENLNIPHWRFKLDDCTVKGTDSSRQYEWRGAEGSKKRVWPAKTPHEMDALVSIGTEYLKSGRKLPCPPLILYLKNPKFGAKRCRVSFLDNRLKEGQLVQDIWLNLGRMKGGSSYPTEKPEILLDRIIRASSCEGDIVLDAFAGSGTTCAVAEKLGRRWIGIDCGKLAIYTIQKRMLNLKQEIGNKGRMLKLKPFTLYNAGLYDFSKLKELSWDSWRFFALQLFQCRDDPHQIGGIQLDGYLKGSSVFIFNHQKQPGVRIDEETIHSIHDALGSKIGKKMFIIAPALTFDFQQDFVEIDNVRYYALRIPYSIIQELYKCEFTALKQPSDELAVNDTVEAVGFDFIRRPELKYTVGVDQQKGKLLEEAFIHIKTFKSEAVVRGPIFKKENLETLSMVMIDFDFDTESDIFDFDAVFYADAIEKNGWRVNFPLESLGSKIMAVFIDIYGNEAREVISNSDFVSVEKKEKLAQIMIKKSVKNK